MTGKTTAFIAATCLVVGFAVGFWPQYQRRSDAERQLAAARQDLEAAKGQLEGATAAVRLSGLLGQALVLRDLVAGQNYGLAQQHATRFFDAVREEAARTPQGSIAASALAAIQDTRDRVTAGVSTADPGVSLMSREIEARLRGALGYQVPDVPLPVVAPPAAAVPQAPLVP